jgi:Flagellar hook-length control protein FliK
MIPSELLGRLAAVLRADPRQLLTAEPASPTLEIPWAVGEKLSAVVEANLVAGRTLARVGEMPLDLKLPFPVKPGERLSLTLVSRQPNLVFALTGPEHAVPQPVQVSTAGQRIGELVNQLAHEQSAQPETAQTAGVAKPLLAQPTLDVGKLALALKQGVSESGLFYESHQAQWVQGERPREALLREPQGKLTPLHQTPVAQAESLITQAEKFPPQVSSTTSDVSTSKVIGDVVRAEAVTQVQQQLHALDARQVVWQGQPWPGLPMQWRIDDPPQRDAQSTAEMTWNTSLNLLLPQLGGVRAHLALTGNQVHVRIDVDAAVARDRLTRQGRELLLGLGNAGLVLGHLSVNVDDTS